MTKRETVKAVTAMAIEGSDDGAECERLVKKLQFWGASAYEYRGFDDTGLSRRTLAKIAANVRGLRYEFFAALTDYLWSTDPSGRHLQSNLR